MECCTRFTKQKIWIQTKRYPDQKFRQVLFHYGFKSVKILHNLVCPMSSIELAPQLPSFLKFIKQPLWLQYPPLCLFLKVSPSLIIYMHVDHSCLSLNFLFPAQMIWLQNCPICFLFLVWVFAAWWPQGAPPTLLLPLQTIHWPPRTIICMEKRLWHCFCGQCRQYCSKSTQIGILWLLVWFCGRTAVVEPLWCIYCPSKPCDDHPNPNTCVEKRLLNWFCGQCR